MYVRVFGSGVWQNIYN